jgi:hypothetical protein
LWDVINSIGILAAISVWMTVVAFAVAVPASGTVAIPVPAVVSAARTIPVGRAMAVPVPTTIAIAIAAALAITLAAAVALAVPTLVSKGKALRKDRRGKQGRGCDDRDGGYGAG